MNPDPYTLLSEDLLVTVSAQGAELQSLRSLTTGIEYLWQGNPSIWPRKAPILFPIVGKPVKAYQHQGWPFQMSQHGFARDHSFDLVSATDEALILVLNSSHETKKHYPFDFQLKVIYTIENTSLKVTYEVLNTGNETMYFSIGAHPGFQCPLTVGEEFEDYYLQFSQDETLSRHLLETGNFNGQTEKILEENNRLPLTKSLFEKDAIVFKGMKSDSITLKSKKSRYFVKLKAQGYPYYGIWSKADKGDFICLEPWHGLADYTSFDGDFSSKEGLVRLESKALFKCSYTIEVG